MLNKTELKALALATAKADKNVAVSYSQEGKTFTYSALNTTLRKELNELAFDYNHFRRNRLDIYELMQEVVDEIVPEKVIARFGDMAEVKQYGQGNKPVFKTPAGRTRAKQFITRVGLAGVYEVFKLDETSFEIKTEAYGGAAQIGLEEFLDGRVNFNDILEIIVEGLDESVYEEVMKALEALTTSLPTANVDAANGFDEATMDALILIAASYGIPVIMATYELASKIVPATGWVSDEMRNTRNNQGHLGIYKGKKVVTLPQSFTDSTNSVKVVNPGYAYIMPANKRPIKIALEGNSIIDDYKNADSSREVQAYVKFGVGVVQNNDMCIYEDTSLTA